MSSLPRFLVLTLYSGENELDACRDSVAAQTGVDATHEVFSGYSNIDAHRALYRKIMDHVLDYDLFLKLDADMVLKRPTALREVAKYFDQRPDLDQMVAMVDDHYTGSRIYGVHTFSPRVRWNLDLPDKLFVDPDPEYDGKLIRNPPEIPVFVDHAPDPSAYQAFHFGYHRMLKALQPGRKHKSGVHAQYQISVLQRVENQYYETGSGKLGLTVLAADLVRKGQLFGQTGDKRDSEVENAFEKAKGLGEQEVRRIISKSRLTRRIAYWWLVKVICKKERRRVRVDRRRQRAKG